MRWMAGQHKCSDSSLPLLPRDKRPSALHCLQLDTKQPIQHAEIAVAEAIMSQRMIGAVLSRHQRNRTAQPQPIVSQNRKR